MKKLLTSTITLVMLASATALGGVPVAQAKATSPSEESIRTGGTSQAGRMCIWVWIGRYKTCT
jgi:hypothetical protein